MDKWVGKLILAKMLISGNSIIETEADWFGVGSYTVSGEEASRWVEDSVWEFESGFWLTSDSE